LAFGCRYWARESDRGETNGLEDRPCAIVLTNELVEGHVVVTAVPITYIPPENPNLVLDIPPRVHSEPNQGETGTC